MLGHEVEVHVPFPLYEDIRLCNAQLFFLQVLKGRNLCATNSSPDALDWGRGWLTSVEL